VFISIDPQNPHIKVGENTMEREMLILMFIFDGNRLDCQLNRKLKNQD
jgi:hypothetical protein